MKTRIMMLLAASALTFIISFGCGGGAGNNSPSDTANPSIVENPEGDSGGSGDGPGDSPAATGTTEDPSAPQMVLISGILTGSEGVGIPDAEITFHSDPVTVKTNSGGLFEALLEVGEHNFEIISDSLGSISGDLTVTASSAINSAGQTLGTFAATITSSGLIDVCYNLRLVDLGEITLINPVIGLIQGGSGKDIEAQGLNQTAIIVGNSEMTANISVDGRLSNLWFPTVGAFNHIPYLSGVEGWVKPFQGSFAGIKRGSDYYWFTNRVYWSRPTIKYQSGTSAPIAELTYTGLGVCSGATVTEKIYVNYDAYGTWPNSANVLMRDYSISILNINNLCKTTSNSSSAPELSMYARFNPNDTYPLFKQWIPAVAETKCEDNRMLWVQTDLQNFLIQNDSLTHSYSIVMEGIDTLNNRLDISCTPYVVTLDDARRVVPDATCSPISVMGSIAEWQIPSSKRIVISTAGCDSAGGPCKGALDQVEGSSLTALENSVKSKWASWLGTPPVGSSWLTRTKRWLVSMKMMADKNTGAIIASPSQEPTYYYSWPRDGVFQSLAFMMAGKFSEAAKFFKYLFDMFPGVESDYGWNQAYSSLDGDKRGIALPDFPDRINIEEDQTPTVLWGLWVYWKKMGSLPSGVTVSSVEDAADYVVAQTCEGTNLIRPSIDKLENPAEHLGQSLYTNAAAVAGLSGAAEMVQALDPGSGKAEDYQAAAKDILSGIEGRLCDSDSCHTRIGVTPAAIPLLGIKASACGLCQISGYVDIPLETMMSFAWPFHIFKLADPRVQSYYDTTWSTDEDFSSFNIDYTLWVPRYLYTYLYAKSAYASSEVSAGTFKNRLLTDTQEVESNIDQLITDVGFLMDQYIGGEETEPESDIFTDYDGITPIHDKLGTASRPLGWSQAMGVLMALANNNKFVPLIDPPCTDECSVSQTMCQSGVVHACVTGASGCREWDEGTACVSGQCDLLGTACSCTTAHHNGCFDDDVYSFNSCNVMEGKALECGEDQWTGSLSCLSGHIYQQLIDKKCLSTSCTQSTSSQKKIDCGTAGCSGTSCCTPHTSSTCSSGDLYWYSSCSVKQDVKQDCDDAGCTSNACCSSNASAACYGSGSSADLYWYSSCSVKQDVKQDCGTAGCSSNACCTSHSSSQCSGDDLYWYSSCSVKQDMKTDCGDDTTGANYCSGNIVKHDDVVRGCSGSSCTLTNQTVTVTDCGTKKQCVSGACSCSSMATPWNNNTLTVANVSGGKLLSWSAPSPNWVQEYHIARIQGDETPPPGMSIKTVTGTSWTDTTGTAPLCYNYVVYAYDACGQQRNGSSIVNVCW